MCIVNSCYNFSKAVENLAGITMKDPVFVDTSEGRSVVADSLGMTATQNILAKSSKDTEDMTANDAVGKIDEESEEEAEIEMEVVKETPTESRRGIYF